MSNLYDTCLIAAQKMTTGQIQIYVANQLTASLAKVAGDISNTGSPYTDTYDEDEEIHGDVLQQIKGLEKITGIEDVVNFLKQFLPANPEKCINLGPEELDLLYKFREEAKK